MARTFIFLGPPGCGKGTQAARLAQNHSMTHFDMGSVLRAEVTAGGEMAQEIASYTSEGKLVPLPVIRRLVERFFRSHAEDDILLDGFPRSSDQVELIEGVLPDLGRCIDAAVMFDLDEDEIKTRILYRRYCPACGGVYNLRTNPPHEDERCDRCGVELARREDDTESVLAERLRVYRLETTPVVEHYREHGTLELVDASGDAATVAQRLQRILDLND